MQPITRSSSLMALAAITLSMAPLGAQHVCDEAAATPLAEPTAEPRATIAQLRTMRLRLIDRQRLATASDDDDEAAELGRRIEQLDRRILDAEESAAAGACPGTDRGFTLPDGLRDGLILHYPFPSSHGRRVLDTSGNDHHGSVHGARWVASGRANGAYRFDGIDDFIETPDCRALESSAAFTASVCLQRELHPEADHQTTSACFLSKSVPASSDFALYLSLSGAVGARIRSDNPAGHHWIDPVPAVRQAACGEWCHVVLICRDGTATIYLNGVLDKIASLPNKYIPSAAPLQIGRCGTGVWQYGFAGRIDDIAIWNRALSEAEILGLWVSLKRSATDPTQLGPVVP